MLYGKFHCPPLPQTVMTVVHYIKIEGLSLRGAVKTKIKKVESATHFVILTNSTIQKTKPNPVFSLAAIEQ